MTDEMTEEIKDFFSPKHKKLLNIASWAGAFAWIVFVVYTLLSASRLVEFTRGYTLDAIFSFFKSYPESGISFITDILSILLRGVVYGLTLKGISLGLNMIVETDINYREQSLGENNER